MTYFWSTGDAWGEVEITPGQQAASVLLRVFHGRLAVARVELLGGETAELERDRILQEGDELKVQVEMQ